MEEWKKIEGYDNYEVSNYGRVRSLDYRHTGEIRILKPKISNNGYEIITLYNKDGGKKFQVHRLVAQSFLSNPDNLPQVNHKDENKTNNRVENLEWCTQQYNIEYSQGIPVLQFDINGNFIQEYKSTLEASRQTGINNSNISQCCKGNPRYSHCGGYIWKFK